MACGIAYALNLVLLVFECEDDNQLYFTLLLLNVSLVLRLHVDILLHFG